MNDTRKEDGKEVFASSEQATFRLWVGSAGTRTPAHHDWSHNFYVLLQGRKRFVLFPPSAASDLYLFPFLHPHATKSQIDVLSSAATARFPRFDASLGFDVTVEAGDVLVRFSLFADPFFSFVIQYIPPFWIHDVSAGLTLCFCLG